MSNGMNALIWLIIAVVLIVIEGATVQLVSIWFIIGTIPTIIAAAMGASLRVQLIIFLVTSVISLIALRPIAKKRLTPKITATNADRVVGMTGIVSVEVNNLKESGRVLIDGLEWTARTKENDLIIGKGEEVKALAIDGVKLIVKPKTN